MGVRYLSFSPETSGESTQRWALLYFITGNPGLIAFYEPFLSTIHAGLKSSPETAFHIYGQDLAGFNDDDHEPFSSRAKPRDLEYQITDCLASIARLRIPEGPRKDQPYDEVILMGHSVGTFLILEVMQRHLRDPSSAPHLNFKAAILLFPTIDHLASSPRGWKLAAIARTPLAPYGPSMARGALSLLPHSVLQWYVNRVMGFPPHASKTVIDWLKSRDGIRQALYLGIDELRAIDEGLWDEELWEITQGADAHDRPVPKFFFFFGKNDCWVANHHRDAFIEKRRKQTERTRLMVDEGDLPHDFCINHSETVAEKALLWITELYKL